jgi:signal transduction histidine kinase
MGVGQSSLGKGRAWMELGNMSRSRSYLDKALAVANLISNKELLRDTYQQLAILHEETGNLKYSLEYYKEYFQLKDTLSSEQRNEQFANMQLMHETAQKDSEIRIMQERQEQQKARLENEEFKNNILVVILALGAVLLFNLYRGSVKRKKINKVLLAHKREIEEKSREMEGLLSMKDKFLSIISHDLRSPINSLLGTIDMLNKGHLSEEESRGLMTSLKNRLTNTRKLLDNLLDWALVQMDEIHIKLKELDLHDIVQENIDFFHETNEKHIIFFNKVPRDTYVLADPNMLELILRNLIVNSIKFTQAGGFIEIDVEQHSDYITVCISDNGIGMTQDQAEKLFDTTQLYSTPGTQNEQGTGLGLKLCKEFIERMEGSIWVESEKDEGSTFKFTLKIPQRIDNSLSSTHNKEHDYGYNILE